MARPNRVYEPSVDCESSRRASPHSPCLTSTSAHLSLVCLHIVEEVFIAKFNAMAEAVIKVGMWSADGGSQWDMGLADHIKSIKICAGGIVDSIAFTYVIGETTEETQRYGGPGGTPNELKFFNEEYLTSISGYIGEYGGTPCISQLRFTTNREPYGPYGGGGGTPFNLPVEEGKIVGFYGRAGTYLNAIGVYLKPK